MIPPILQQYADEELANMLEFPAGYFKCQLEFPLREPEIPLGVLEIPLGVLEKIAFKIAFKIVLEFPFYF